VARSTLTGRHPSGPAARNLRESGECAWGWRPASHSYSSSSSTQHDMWLVQCYCIGPSVRSTLTDRHPSGTAANDIRESGQCAWGLRPASRSYSSSSSTHHDMWLVSAIASAHLCTAQNGTRWLPSAALRRRSPCSHCLSCMWTWFNGILDGLVKEDAPDMPLNHCCQVSPKQTLAIQITLAAFPARPLKCDTITLA